MVTVTTRTAVQNPGVTSQQHGVGDAGGTQFPHDPQAIPANGYLGYVPFGSQRDVGGSIGDALENV
jgi:hypothetical protein